MNALGIKILAAVLLSAIMLSAYVWWAGHQREIGREEVRAEWKARDAEQTRINARETLRRFEAQQRNQEIQHAQLEQAQAAAARLAATSERMRQQHAQAADIWGRTLRHSPTAADLAAAAEAIRVQSELLGRARARAGVLARYADAARIAGEGCQRDYDSIATVKP